MRVRRTTAMAVLFLLVGGVLGACAGSGGRADDGRADGQVAGELMVFAAASLTDAFGELAEGFEAEHPGSDVVLNLAGSQTLAAQLLEGAAADVFASADAATMEVVVDEGLASESVPFARNRLEVVVEAGNPHDIRGLTDLTRPELVVVLAAEEVPAGRYTAELLVGADLEVAAASLEASVRAVLSKVAIGEADAGVVYRSDVVAGGDRVEGVAIQDADNVVASYPIAVLDAAPNEPAARAFAAYVRSDDGQRVLRAAGLEPVA